MIDPEMRAGSMSQLPNIDAALIPQRKIAQSFLSLTHDTGRDKAIFFRQFGFTTEAWEVLAHALRSHAAQHEIAKIEAAPFGTRDVVEGTLPTPSDRLPQVRVVWFIDHGEQVPRFVTAYPL